MAHQADPGSVCKRYANSCYNLQQWYFAPANIAKSKSDASVARYSGPGSATSYVHFGEGRTVLCVTETHPAAIVG